MPVWKEAMELAELTFQVTDVLPKKEDYGLTSQLRRSALSISGNIAEAFGRYHISDKINFYYYSRGSITETMSHLDYGLRVGYFKQDDIIKLNDKLYSLLEAINKLIKSLKVQYKPNPQSQSKSQSKSKD